MAYLKKNYNFSMFQRGWGPTFSGVGGPVVQLLIPIETYRTCDFPERSGPLSSPRSLHGT